MPDALGTHAVGRCGSTPGVNGFRYTAFGAWRRTKSATIVATTFGCSRGLVVLASGLAGGGRAAAQPTTTCGQGVTLPFDLNGRKEGRVGVAERELEVRRAQIAERERRLRAEVRAKAGEFLAAQRTLTTVGEVLAANRRALSAV